MGLRRMPLRLTDSCTHWGNLLKLQIEIFAFYLRNANALSARFSETPTCAPPPEARVSGQTMPNKLAIQIRRRHASSGRLSKKGQEFRWGYNLCVWPPERWMHFAIFMARPDFFPTRFAATASSYCLASNKKAIKITFYGPDLRQVRVLWVVEKWRAPCKRQTQPSQSRFRPQSSCKYACSQEKDQELLAPEGVQWEKTVKSKYYWRIQDQ